jgi:hypothetical protein
MRCEDFPCCGHYDEDSGEIFCHEATRTPKQKAMDEAIARIEREYADLEEAQRRRRVWENAPEEHDEETCGAEEDAEGNVLFCRECIVLAENDEQEAMEYARDYGDHY